MKFVLHSAFLCDLYLFLLMLMYVHVAEQSILEWDGGVKDVITKEKEENKIMVESAQEKAIRTVVETGARSDEKMVAKMVERTLGKETRRQVHLWRKP